MKKFKLFLSYCSVDSDMIDILEQKILNSEYAYIFDISRYTRDVAYRESFQEYMDSIGDYDFVITLISDNYLKSKACMYEVSKLLDGSNLSKFLYIVVDRKDEEYCRQFPLCRTKAAEIYTPEGQLAYISYWDNQRKVLEQSIKELDRPYMHPETAENLRRVDHILYHEIDPLLKYLNKHKSISLSDVEKSGPKILFGEEILYEHDEVPPLAPEERLKKEIIDQMRPLYAPFSTIGEIYYIGNLPRYLRIVDDRLFFNNRWSEHSVCGVGIREFGPDAWSPSISLPVGAFFRRISSDRQTEYGWCRAKEKLQLYIESVGNGIDVIEIEKKDGDHTAVWTTYVAYDIDLT